jgi:hypothetical protein
MIIKAGKVFSSYQEMYCAREALKQIQQVKIWGAKGDEFIHESIIGVSSLAVLKKRQQCLVSPLSNQE